MQTMPYYHPFSNPSAAAVMVAFHSGTPMLSEQRITQIAHILGSLGSDLNPVDLANFDAALEQKKLDAYLANASKTAFRHKDGWIEKFRLFLDKKKTSESSAVELEIGDGRGDRVHGCVPQRYFHMMHTEKFGQS
jgi:hypothetical protein